MAYPQLSFPAVTLHPGSLLYNRRQAVTTNTLRYQLDILKKTGRYSAFNLQWQPIYSDPPETWPVPKHLFWDSDIAKWIEGACYILMTQPPDQRDSKIVEAINELVGMIASAQQSDGYINIHYTVVDKGKRWTNLRDMHELYNAGHLIEAALAHEVLFKNHAFLDPICRYVDLLCEKFGPEEGKIHGYPGHPEIELALLRLYERTKKKKYLDLARYFILERGTKDGDGKNFFQREAEKRGEKDGQRPGYWIDTNCQWYYQAHEEIVKQETIEGHSVRAMYLLAAVADFVRLDEDGQRDEALLVSVRRLWNNMVQKKMYLTGGIGSMKQYEGFGIDYFLPQGTDEGGCYAETCAAIGVMMLAERLLQIELDGQIADIMELSLYNAVLTAMSHDGKKFTYVNQLASTDDDPSQRSDWFVCACCPPNIMRVLGQIGGYVHSVDTKQATTTVNVHLFISSMVRFEIEGSSATLTQTSDWPWSGDIDFALESASSNVALNVRIPEWADDWTITPSVPKSALQKGYLRLTHDWVAANPKFRLRIPIRPRLLSPHPHTRQDIIAVARGPIVYCVEDCDNSWVQDHFKNVQLDPTSAIKESVVTDSETGDKYVGLSVKQGASTADIDGVLFSPSAPTSNLLSRFSKAKVIDQLNFVPYFFRSNRGGKGQSRVGLRRWAR